MLLNFIKFTIKVGGYWSLYCIGDPWSNIKFYILLLMENVYFYHIKSWFPYMKNENSNYICSIELGTR